MSQGAKEALRLAFAPDGGPVQDILLREMARYAAAAASELAMSVSTAPASALLIGLAEAQQTAAEAMGPARPPLPTAMELFAPFTAAARQTEADRETLRVAVELQELVASLTGGAGRGLASPGVAGGGLSLGAGGSSLSPRAGGSGGTTTSWMEVPLFGEVPMPTLSFPGMDLDQELVRELMDMVPELAPGAQAAALRFGSVLLDQTAERVANADRAATANKQLK